VRRRCRFKRSGLPQSEAANTKPEQWTLFVNTVDQRSQGILPIDDDHSWRRVFCHFGLTSRRRDSPRPERPHAPGSRSGGVRVPELKGPLATAPTTSGPPHLSLEAARRLQIESALSIAIVEHASDAIIAKMLDGRVIAWNAGAERIFGYTATEVIGGSITRVFPPDRLHPPAHIRVRVEGALPVIVTASAQLQTLKRRDEVEGRGRRSSRNWWNERTAELRFTLKEMAPGRSSAWRTRSDSRTKESTRWICCGEQMVGCACRVPSCFSSTSVCRRWMGLSFSKSCGTTRS